MLAVGTRLRSNETLGYHLKLPATLHRIDANPLAQNRGYVSQSFVHGDALLALDELADRLEGRLKTDTAFPADLAAARKAAEALVDASLGPYVRLKDELNRLLQGKSLWVRDITLSNSMWGNRSLTIDDPRAGVHALGGGIGQGLAMGIGAAIGGALHTLGRKTVTLVGDGGLMLNIGELACAAQEGANMVLLVMNDRGYGVIKNIQDAVYGARRCYVDLHTPDFALLCKSLAVPHLRLAEPGQTESVLREALAMTGPVMVEVDMQSWGPFAAKFAGPPRRTS
jgi:acetolactate synthase-1/2/3 large subunit